MCNRFQADHSPSNSFSLSCLDGDKFIELAIDSNATTDNYAPLKLSTMLLNFFRQTIV